jgi:hypothetical protein
MVRVSVGIYGYDNMPHRIFERTPIYCPLRRILRRINRRGPTWTETPKPATSTVNEARMEWERLKASGQTYLAAQHLERNFKKILGR